MLHVIYEGDVHPKEAVKRADVAKLTAYRVKTKNGKYKVVVVDSEQAIKDYVKSNGDAE